MNKDTDGGLQPGRDPDDIDAAQAALNRMREAAAARGEIRRKAPPRPGTSAAEARPQCRGTSGFAQFHGTGRDPLGLGKVVGRLVARARLELAGGRRFGDGASGQRSGGTGDLRPLHARRVLRTPPSTCAAIPPPGPPSCGCSASACWRNSAPNSATAS